MAPLPFAHAFSDNNSSTCLSPPALPIASSPRPSLAFPAQQSAIANRSDLSESSINKPNLKNRAGLIAPYGAMLTEFNLKSQIVISSLEQT